MDTFTTDGVNSDGVNGDGTNAGAVKSIESSQCKIKAESTDIYDQATDGAVAETIKKLKQTAE